LALRPFQALAAAILINFGLILLDVMRILSLIGSFFFSRSPVNGNFFFQFVGQMLIQLVDPCSLVIMMYCVLVSEKAL